MNIWEQLKSIFIASLFLDRKKEIEKAYLT